MLTDPDLSGLSATYSLSKADELSSKNCLSYLQGDGESATVNLFVDKPADFNLAKAIVKEQKKVRGLTSGYSGEISGGDVPVGFKTVKNAISITSSALEAPDLIVVAKAIKNHLSAS